MIVRFLLELFLRWRLDLAQAFLRMKYQKLEAVHDGQKPNLFNICADTSLRLLLAVTLPA